MTLAVGSPVISLWQPWASLIFSGHKLHETRTRHAPMKYIGKRIAIAATAKFPPLKHVGEEVHELCMDVFGCGYNHTLPQGCILGTVLLRSSGKCGEVIQPLDDDDRVAGDWALGRYAWLLGLPNQFRTPIPAKGSQGWWFYKG